MQGKGKSLTVPGDMGCMGTGSRLTVCLGSLEWFTARLQTEGLHPLPSPDWGGGVGPF